ncbi:MAG: hypothetical protein QNJ97_21965 [Myxococcota bacterium]|nr:hypothetical protein [Myxococcota bacterium]
MNFSVAAFAFGFHFDKVGNWYSKPTAAKVSIKRRVPVFIFGLCLAAIAFYAVLSDASERSNPSPPPPAIAFAKNAEGTKGLKLTIYLRTDMATAWPLLSQPNSGAYLFDNVTSIRPLPNKAHLYAFQIDSIIGEKNVICSMRADQKMHTVRWHRVWGDLHRFEGSWRIEPAEAFPGFIRAEYVNFIDPGGIAGLLMTNSRRKRMVEKMIPKLRQLVETGR